MTVIQLLVVVWDSGNPSIEVDTTVTITMRRNEFVPTFFPARYEVSVSEHDVVGMNITKVTATDQDIKVSLISILMSCILVRSMQMM